MRIIQGELIYKRSNYRSVLGGLEHMRDHARAPHNGTITTSMSKGTRRGTGARSGKVGEYIKADPGLREQRDEVQLARGASRESFLLILLSNHPPVSCVVS